MGAVLGLCGVLLLIENSGGTAQTSGQAVFYLSLIGIAAALWGVYSLVSRSFADVPSGAMGTFYAAAAIVAGLGHFWQDDSPTHQGTAVVRKSGLGGTDFP